ncbi:hypothetical protein N7535_008952 [Penicillium sp. DV-2018c]|nr:hypothetical protein N7535_008952 [Penicillium sp. DV-2018c]
MRTETAKKKVKFLQGDPPVDPLREIGMTGDWPTVLTAPLKEQTKQTGDHPRLALASLAANINTASPPDLLFFFKRLYFKESL